MNLDRDLMNSIFEDPLTVLEAVQALRTQAQKENKPFPARIVLNPDVLNKLVLFGCLVVWDSTATGARLEWDGKSE